MLKLTQFNSINKIFKGKIDTTKYIINKMKKE